MAGAEIGHSLVVHDQLRMSHRRKSLHVTIARQGTWNDHSFQILNQISSRKSWYWARKEYPFYVLFFKFICTEEFEGCSSFSLMRTNKTTSELLFDREEKGNQIYLEWLKFVYPRFQKYYKGLEQDAKSDRTRDQYKFPVEMFCNVNIPKIVSLT